MIGFLAFSTHVSVDVYHVSVLQRSLPLYLVQLLLLKAVFALRKLVNKLKSRDITELVTLCGVCKQWRSAFDITQRRRLNALWRREFFTH